MTGKECAVLLLLAVNSLWDIRKKTICSGCAACFALGGVICMIADGQAGWMRGFFGLLPGIFLVGISLISRGSVGFGDGLILMVMGLYLGFSPTMTVLFWGILLGAVFGMGLLVFRRADKKTAFPFVPFLLGGFMINLLLFS